MATDLSQSLTDALRGTNSFSTYRKFNDKALANELIELLNLHKIPYELEDSSQFFDPSYAYNEALTEIRIRLLPQDFEKVNVLLQEDYQKVLDAVGSDYYLYTFSDEELLDVIVKPDEWGMVDQMLAPRILKERGKEVSPEIIEMLGKNRLKELEKPEEASRYIIYVGYFFSLIGGLVGVFIGWHLTFFKKTLPDGTKHYAYKDKDRDHGTRMILISAVILIAFAILRYS